MDNTYNATIAGVIEDWIYYGHTFKTIGAKYNVSAQTVSKWITLYYFKIKESDQTKRITLKSKV